jgi:hypothetical protein
VCAHWRGLLLGFLARVRVLRCGSGTPFPGAAAAAAAAAAARAGSHPVRWCCRSDTQYLRPVLTRWTSGIARVEPGGVHSERALLSARPPLSARWQT